MPVCIKCHKRKFDRCFRLVKKNRWDKAVLIGICIDCERAKSAKCIRCGKIVWDPGISQAEVRLYQCENCQRQAQEIIEKNRILKSVFNIEALLRKTKRMSTNVIGDLRSRLFETIDGLKAGTIKPEVSEQIVSVAKTIIDSARAENEFIQITGSAGSGFIPVSGGNLNNQKQLA